MKKIIELHKREIAFGGIILFVASLCFALGYNADQQFNHIPIVIEKCSQ